MDTELARTFLKVIETGNFITAAERLHVSQSTISARINTLEQQLGCTLFVRSKAGTALTPAGRQFQRHASALVRTVQQARQDVGVPEGFHGTLAIGGRIGLWEEFLLHWLPRMHADHPGISLRADSALEPELMQDLIEGRIDIGVMYTPQSRPGLKLEKLFDERLVMVSTTRKAAPEPQPGYVYVDWGPEFFARHSAYFPGFRAPALAVNIGWLGLQQILGNGGSGYFPIRIVSPHILARRLHLVEGAPEFVMPAYALHPVDRNDAIIQAALALMHRVADAQIATARIATPAAKPRATRASEKPRARGTRPDATSRKKGGGERRGGER